MADLYLRLDEIQGMTRMLGEDVAGLERLIGERSIEVETTEGEHANRRFYVRAVFALIEAVVEQHRLLLLDLLARRVGSIPDGEKAVLSETGYELKDNGTVSERRQYLQLRKKIRLVYRCAALVFSGQITSDFGGQGWQALLEAIAVRDRITHPKTRLECIVDEDALDLVDAGHAWFKSLNNEFVALARASKHAEGW